MPIYSYALKNCQEEKHNIYKHNIYVYMYILIPKTQKKKFALKASHN